MKIYYAMTEPNEEGVSSQCVFIAETGYDIFWALDASGFSPRNCKFCLTNCLPPIAWVNIPVDNLMELPDEIVEGADDTECFYECGTSESYFNELTQWYMFSGEGYDIVECQPFKPLKE